jgi:hypothetical protein
MITRPAAGFSALRGSVVPVRGFAWSGQVPLARVDLSVDHGAHWEEAELESGLAGHPFAWRRFHGHVTMPDEGTTQIMARATDFRGRSQPLDSAPWNPRGYCNNGVHRVPGVIASS